MNAILWVVQSLVAAAFLASGGMKLGMSHDALAAKLAWVAHVPAWLVRFIGSAEILGALGLVLPAATRVQPWLTPLSSASLALVMMLAIGLHIVRDEASLAIPAGMLAGLCLFLTIGRVWLAPIAFSRSALRAISSELDAAHGALSPGTTCPSPLCRWRRLRSSSGSDCR